MTRRRWVAAALGLVLVAIAAVVWVIPAVSGPEVECIDIDPVACDRLWRDMLAEMNEPLVDALGRNRVREVIVTKQLGVCDTASIDVRFTDGTGIYRNPGLC